jgi:hypothetical protein
MGSSRTTVESMGNVEHFGDAAVLFLADSPSVERRIAAWLPDVPTTFAASVEEAYAEFDDSVAVVCYPDAWLGDRTRRFCGDVLARSPFTQLVLLASPESSAVQYDDDYDVILEAPVSEHQLRAAVERRLAYAVYGSVLHEYYSLNARVAATEGFSDDGGETVSGRVTDRLDQLRPWLRHLQAKLSPADVREISESVTRHKGYLTRPAPGAERGGSSKYHPDACPECDLPWGSDHRNELGRGYEPIGAGVWKCARCDEVVHGLHDSNQRITKR